jgi:hypothetical protein
MHWRNCVRVALIIPAAGFIALSQPSVLAIGPEVIYTKIPTDPSSIVPGALDLAGQPAVTNFRALEDLFVSPDGTRWVIRGRTQQGADLETITLIGSGISGTMLLQEGQPVPDETTGELIDFFGSGVGRFDDNSNFALSLRARGGSNTQFQKVLVYTGDLTPTSTDFALAARGGNTPGVELYTGLTDLAPNPSGDETIGNSIGSIHLLNNGTLGAQDSTINLIHTSRRPAIFYSKAGALLGGAVTFDMFQQTGVTTFLSLDGSISHTYGTLGANTFYTTPDGANWVVNATILGAPTISDAVLVVNGKAEIQENSPVGTSDAIAHSIVTTEILTNGDWFSRGLRRVVDMTTSNGVWAARNGELIAQTGDPVSTAVGPVESWASAFLAFTGNINGDWVLVGRTDNADTAIDDVVVFNGDVVLREGDPIDLDGNGSYDDNAFIGRGTNTLSAFEANDFALTDDGMLYFFPTLRDGQGNDLNSDPAFGTSQAFLRLNLGGVAPCPADIFGDDGQVNIDDLLLVINSWGVCEDPCPPCVADIDGNCNVNIDDLLTVINAWGACD